MSDNVVAYPGSMQDEPISPEEVERREFTLARRGYDQHEVRAFQRRTAFAYRVAINERRSAIAAAERAEMELAEVKNRAHEEFDSAQERAQAALDLEEARSIRAKAAHDLEEAKALKAEAVKDFHMAESLREQAARDLEEARAARQETTRMKDEAEAALSKATEMNDGSRSNANRAPLADPYGIAGQQISNMLRAADEMASELRRESEEIRSAAQRDAQSVMEEARTSGERIQTEARERAAAEEIKAQKATEQYQRVISTMSALEGKVQEAIADAIRSFDASAEEADELMSPEAEDVSE